MIIEDELKLYKQMKKITTGQLFGFAGETGETWVAVGVVLELNEVFKIKFSLENNTYDVLGKRENTIYYTGKLRVSYKKGDVGNVYVWVYQCELGIVINGQWIEEHITYELFGKFSWAK